MHFIQRFSLCSHGGLGALGFQDVCGGNFWNGRSEGKDFGQQVFPLGATKHLGNEVFQAISDQAVLGYSKYFGPPADQALNPMPNPVEQNIDRQSVCKQVASAKYAALYKLAWTVDINCNATPAAIHASDVQSENQFDISFKRIMLAVSAWQHSGDVNPFSSRRDKALKCDRQEDDRKFPLKCKSDPSLTFTDQENYGHALFYATRFAPLISNDPSKNGKFANCAFCHSDNPVIPGPGIKDTGEEEFQTYTAQDYHNIGVPPNLEIPVTYKADGTKIDPDEGVAGHTIGANSAYPLGFFKTPSLRNVDMRKGKGFKKAYTHNGWFKSLESIVHFYNTAFIGGTTANSFGVTRCPANITTEKDALANNCWPAPAYGRGAIPFLVGDLRLTAEDEAAIVAYLKTFTDTATPKAPPPYK